MRLEGYWCCFSDGIPQKNGNPSSLGLYIWDSQDAWLIEGSVSWVMENLIQSYTQHQCLTHSKGDSGPVNSHPSQGHRTKGNPSALLQLLT